MNRKDKKNIRDLLRDLVHKKERKLIERKRKNIRDLLSDVVRKNKKKMNKKEEINRRKQKLKNNNRGVKGN